MPNKLNSSPSSFALFSLCALLAFSACNRQQSKPATNTQSAQRYALKGKVVSIDRQAATANIDNEPIPGFMDSMVMAYPFKPTSALDQLQPGDSITADVVVADPGKYWLENVKVVAHSKPDAAKPAAKVHTPTAGDEVPDFQLVNQNGRHISLRQYRGQTLVLTFIYTRCPFPDFCPRVTHEFSTIDRSIRADPTRYANTHLLSISFDPARDTPKQLRAYGFFYASTKDPALFKRWEFAAIPATELPEFADYFALIYKEEGGVLVHSLSTAVISPNGKIFKWYRGADWQASDLLQDIAAAHSAG